MLLQSHERAAGSGVANQEFVLHLLPALPKAWPGGSVKGLRARGNFTVDIEWQDGRATTYRIASPEAREVQVRVNGELLTVRAEKLNSPAVSNPKFRESTPDGEGAKLQEEDK
jgi:hypothetical protein